MENQIKFLLQIEVEPSDWTTLRCYDDYDEAEEKPIFRKKLDNPFSFKYRIVRATTTYEVMEEAK